MTKRQTMEQKYCNAVRALKGGVYAVPQKMAEKRVDRWIFRLKTAGIPLPTVVVWTRVSLTLNSNPLSL